MPDPQGNLVTPIGIDAAGNLYALLVDAAGRLQVHDEELGAGTVIIRNVTMTLADTEYGQAMPAHTKKFMVKCRTNYPVQLCFTALGSDTLYITIPPGQTYWEDILYPLVTTLYFRCPVAAQVLEIVAWS